MKNIREKLKNNELSIGTWMQIPSPEIAEILSKSGKFDWIALDIEHGLFTIEKIQACITAIMTGKSSAFVRVTEVNKSIIKHCLEAGAKGLIFPMISNLQDISYAIDHSLYPPIGKRGIGFSRANLFGSNFTEYFSSINEELTLVAQIESIEAVENLENILSHKRLDAIMIGPYDLSGSMGITGQFKNQDFVNTLNSIKKTVKESSVALGTHVVTPNQDDLTNAINEGNKFVAYGIDALFLNNGISRSLN